MKIVLIIFTLFIFHFEVSAACTGSSPNRSAPDTGNATTNGSNFQDCLNNAVGGDTITITAGASYNGGAEGFLFPNKAGSSYITITTSNLAGIPSDLLTYPTLDETGFPRRISTAEAANMPKLIGVTEGQPTIKFAASAHHWKFIGIEITNAPSVDYQVTLIVTDGLSSFVWFERCFLHPSEETGSISSNYQNRSIEKGILFNGDNLYVYDTAIQGFTGFGQGAQSSLNLDTNAILWGVGTGQGEIKRNLLEGQANNVFTGGSGGVADPAHTATITGATINPTNGTFTATFSSTTDLEIGDYFGLLNSSLFTEGNCLPEYTGGLGKCTSGWTNAQVSNKVGNVITATTGLRTEIGYRKHYIEIFHSDNTGNRYPATISGTFTLTFMGQTTSAITYSSNHTTLMNNIQSALEALSNIAPGDIRLVDDPNWGIFVDFGDLSAVVGIDCGDPDNFCGGAWAYPTEIEVMTGNDSGLVGTNADLYVHLKGQEYAAGLRTEAQNTPPNGSEVKWEGITLRDVVFEQNIIAKYEIWYQHQGSQKGYIEFKTGIDTVVNGNVFFWDGNLPAPGALVLTPRQDGGCTWCLISGLDVTNNWFQTPVLMGLALKDAIYFGPESFGINISNNLINNPSTSNPPQFYSNTSGGSISLIHNTFLLGQGRFIEGHGTMVNAIIKDNIVRAGALLFCLAPNPTDLPFDCWPATQADNQKNLIINDQGWLGNIANPDDSINGQWLQDWSNQLYTTSLVNLFVAPNATLGHKVGNYRVHNSSAFKNGASDGTDPGVNYTTLTNNLTFDPSGIESPQEGPRKCNWSVVCN